MPRLREFDILFNPILTIALFSSIKGIMSATVPRAAMSEYSNASSPISACDNLKATPTPARGLNG